MRTKQKTGVLIVLLVAGGCTLWAGCSKESTTPTMDPAVATAEGAPKISGDAFIGLTSAGPITFLICGTGQQLITNANNAVLYNCTCKSNAQVSIATNLGGSPIKYCFTEDVWYDIKATTGPANRQTLHIKFPVGYSDCTLLPATKMDYDPVTGIWAAAGALNGVQWWQSFTGHC